MVKCCDWALVKQKIADRTKRYCFIQWFNKVTKVSKMNG
jgi:hypothetical protein